jgi:hypothetical protein
LPTREVFAGGLFSRYHVNVYDGHYTLPETLVFQG